MEDCFRRVRYLQMRLDQSRDLSGLEVRNGTYREFPCPSSVSSQRFFFQMSDRQPTRDFGWDHSLHPLCAEGPLNTVAIIADAPRLEHKTLS
jgi:hypothetical protein